ncbi:GTP-binding signal recognition particle SRP54 G- domain protein [Nitrosococcus halophilus Nc 4]|uniref:Flagellar biosynthesis protein FlhF n=1 Tax=Nitrosococcus halophilus (strain Nc4) TaxID=472759 RepID=D5C246_NITHN|nr:flagellar biosynthesis protein FlhF [Nitrosococcus halophilus]ADE16634.1 GTP-binding signal recognition particle SRP54 G- domain protein [Nitrosococcus halophilus Nc 4]
MKIRRFTAPDVRQAIRQVREAMGADAVILSNRSVDGGVEIVAATDYEDTVLEQASDSRHRQEAEPLPERRPVPNAPRDESQEPLLLEMRQEMKTLRNLVETQLSDLAWGELGRRHPLKAQLLRRLIGLDLVPELCRQLAAQVSNSNDPHQIWQQAVQVLTDLIPIADDDTLTTGGIVALIGPTGVGKTTSVAKIAARFALRRGIHSVALVTTDSFRIGAQEQLHTYGRILGVPVKVAQDRQALEEILDGLLDRQLVLIDTAGMSQRDMHLTKQFAMLAGGGPKIRNYLVLSAATQSSALDEVVQQFNRVELSGCILTKIDEAASLGGIVSTVIRHQLPLAYISDGQRVPEDFGAARAQHLVHLLTEYACEREKGLADEVLAQAFGRAKNYAHV